MADSAMWGEAKAFDTSTAAPTGDVFADATIGSRQTEDIVKTTDEGTFTDVTTFQKFTDGWGTTTGGTIKFEITAKNIGMIYYMTVDGQSGVAAVKVDGEDVATINADFTSGWGNYAKAQQIYSSDEVATHTVVAPSLMTQSLTSRYLTGLFRRIYNIFYGYEFVSADFCFHLCYMN